MLLTKCISCGKSIIFEILKKYLKKKLMLKKECITTTGRFSPMNANRQMSLKIETPASEFEINPPGIASFPAKHRHSCGCVIRRPQLSSDLSCRPSLLSAVLIADGLHFVRDSRRYFL